MKKEDLLFLYCRQLLLFYCNLHTTIGCAQVFCNIYDSEQIVTAIVPYRYKDMSPTSAIENFVPVPMLM